MQPQSKVNAMAQALPNTLPALLTREAIQDTIYRVVTGIDMGNRELFQSAFVEDAVFDLDGRVMQGLNAITKGCFDGFDKLDTTHFITNVRIDVKWGSSTAVLTCSALAQHFRPGEGVKPGAQRLLAGSLYTVDLCCDPVDGLWKVKVWKMKVVWAEGDWSVVTFPRKA